MSGNVLFIVSVFSALLTVLALAFLRPKKISPIIRSDPYAFSFTSIDGTALPLAPYHDKLLLVVNTASKCGFTGQYKGLQALHERYGPRGLVIVGVPSNDFGGQEPEACEIIRGFTREKFGVTFALTEKQKVKGAHAHPFFRWLAQENGWLAAPRWNFYKYLIAPGGKRVRWYFPFTKPENAGLIRDIEASLPTP